MYLEVIDLINEWNDIKIYGEEHAKVINENHETIKRKREEILAYRDRVINSKLSSEEKEKRLKEIRENLNYLATGNPNNESDSLEVIVGIVSSIGTTLVMRFIEYMLKNYKQKVSDDILNDLYSKLDRAYKI